jgi:4-cresol dehydrogenase (hydroxylating)
MLAGQTGKLKFLSERKLALAKRYARPFQLATGWDLSRTVELVEPILGLMRGVPTTHSLASAYWRKRAPVPSDPNPDRDRCGLLWYSPVVPPDGELVEALARTASGILLKFGFEPMISLTMLTPRTVHSVISITYDRDAAGQDEQALECYEELVQQCTAQGAYPYRLGIQSMSKMEQPDGYAALLASLKQALDPNGILAPGRYEIIAGGKTAVETNVG